jgi:hypothetical protein
LKTLRFSDPSTPRAGLWIVAILAGMTAMQFVAGRMNATNQAAGIGRNDLVLAEDDLPDTIDKWQRVSFEPAKLLADQAEEQRVWTHSWGFQKDLFSAYVAFDQAGFMHWHDLTVCYQGLGWTITSKQVLSSTENLKEWPIVVAQLSKPDGSTAMLAFSSFFDNGDPVDARVYEVAKTAEEGFKRLLSGRFNGQQRTSKVASLRQCQVLFPYAGTLTSDMENSIIKLHLQSRQSFRDHWLAHWKTLRAGSDQ